MKVSWHYNMPAESQSYYLKMNKNFIRMVNIIHQAQPDLIDKIWGFIKEIKTSWSLEVGIYDATSLHYITTDNMVRTSQISKYLDDLEKEFSLTNISKEPIHDVIKEETYKIGSDMFFYLSLYPEVKWALWMGLYKDLLKSFSLKKIVTTLAGISRNSEEKIISNFVLDQMFEIRNMTYKKIESATVRKTEPFEEKNTQWGNTGTMRREIIL